MQLISDEYCKLNSELHKDNKRYGASGVRHADTVIKLSAQYNTRDILDYGCGKSALARNLPFKIKQYDPAIYKYSALPTPADIVMCTDVLEHIEENCLEDVLIHLASLTKVVGYFTACVRPAKKTLSDGRNAHLIVQPADWWLKKFCENFKIIKLEVEKEEVVVLVESKLTGKFHA